LIFEKDYFIDVADPFDALVNRCSLDDVNFKYYYFTLKSLPLEGVSVYAYNHLHESLYVETNFSIIVKIKL
jgi:hypothetical protein